MESAARSSGISSVGSYATALTFFMTEQPNVRANSHAFDASIGRLTEACFGLPNHALLSAAWNRFFSCNTGFAG
jgi:hypothetical protein